MRSCLLNFCLVNFRAAWQFADHVARIARATGAARLHAEEGPALHMNAIALQPYSSLPAD
jgi:hypothetical protein